MERQHDYDESDLYSTEPASEYGEGSAMEDLEELETWDLDEMLDLVPSTFD